MMKKALGSVAALLLAFAGAAGTPLAEINVALGVGLGACEFTDIEVVRDEESGAFRRQYGPIHACRPTGNLGVSALYAGGESAIAWAR